MQDSGAQRGCIFIGVRDGRATAGPETGGIGTERIDPENTALHQKCRRGTGFYEGLCHHNLNTKSMYDILSSLASEIGRVFITQRFSRSPRWLPIILILLYSCPSVVFFHSVSELVYGNNRLGQRLQWVTCKSRL